MWKSGDEAQYASLQTLLSVHDVVWCIPPRLWLIINRNILVIFKLNIEDL